MLARAILVTTLALTSATTVFVKNWVIPDCISTHLLADYGLQFALTFFTVVTARMGIKHMITAAYHPQTNGQLKILNRTDVQPLGHYGADHQRVWDQFGRLWTYPNNAQIHRSTGMTQFNLVLSRHSRSTNCCKPGYCDTW